MNRTHLANAGLAVASIIVSLLVLEFVASKLEGSPVYRWQDRLMFFGGGDVFQNFKGGFKYAPRRRILSQTYYLKDGARAGLDLEYEYYVETNNLGLIQKTDAKPDVPSLLILGDSHVEGQGAPPWFYGFEQSFRQQQPGLQLLNGGVLGAGMAQFKNLYDELKARVKITKIVVVFISHDWIRPILQMPPRTLRCISSWKTCVGDEDFYGLPAAKNMRAAHIDKMAAYRRTGPAGVKEWLKSFAIVRLVWNATNSLWRGGEIERGKAAAASLTNAVGHRNALFIHLPAKDEVLNGMSPLGAQARQYLRQKKFALVDGFKACNLNAADYHKNDGHPNMMGYGKIRSCIEAAIKNHFFK